MKAPIIAFFNNKGGVGKTSLVFHLAWMFGELGLNVLAADLDPQSNLTSAFLDESKLEDLFSAERPAQTIHATIQPLVEGEGDILDPALQPVSERLWLLCGDLRLSSFEDQLAECWPKCLDGDKRAFRVTSAFWRVLRRSAASVRADLVLLDAGPSLGSINRAALIASDYVIVPLAPDLFSLQGLSNLGRTVSRWRGEWEKRRAESGGAGFELPSGAMEPAGYIVQQHAIRLDRPVQAYGRWMNKIPAEYRAAVLQQGEQGPLLRSSEDPHCLQILKNYRSLMPLAHEARKPMFFLKAADGALGAHATAALDAYHDFKRLAQSVAARCRIGLPTLEQGG